MSFTKIAAAGIGSTETVTLHSLEVLNNATVGGVLTYEDVTNVDSIGIITARAGVLVGSGITLSKDGDIFATGVTTATKFVGDGSELTGVASTDNIRTNTNATFLQNINVSGTATVGGEANFASNLSIGGNISIPDKIIHTDDTNTSIRFPAVDKVTVETSGTERLAIEPAGNVNVPKSVVVGTGLTVGSATSTSTFIGQGSLELTRSDGSAHIDFKNAFADDYDARIITSGGNQLQFFTGGEGATLCALQTATAKVAIATDVSPSVAKLEVHSDKLGGTAGNTQELLLLKSPDVSNSTTYRFTNYRLSNGTTHVTSEGRLRRHVDATDMGFIGFGDGYVKIGYGTAEKARFPSTGGITFNGDTSTDNALDDYEEGSFTPIIKFGGSTNNQTYENQMGRYTKIGNRVVFHLYVKFSNKGTASGTADIYGLPFTAASVSVGYAHCSAWMNQGNFGETVPTGYIPPSQTYYNIERQRCDNGTGVSSCDNTNFNNNTDMMVAGSYITTS